MKNMKNRSHTLGKISSLEDLRLEKARLQMEILKKENQIQADYKHLLDRLTFRNVIRNIKDDIAMTTDVTSKVISVGKKIFGKNKKKKKDQEMKNGLSASPGTMKQDEEPAV